MKSESDEPIQITNKNKRNIKTIESSDDEPISRPKKVPVSVIEIHSDTSSSDITTPFKKRILNLENDSDSIITPTSRKLKKRVTRSMNIQPEIFELPSSESENESIEYEPVQFRRPLTEIHDEDIDEEDILSFSSQGSESPLDTSNLLYCVPCKSFQPIDNFSHREKNNPKYGIDSRFCLKHASWTGDQSRYIKDLDAQLKETQKIFLEIDENYNLSHSQFQDIISEQSSDDDFIVENHVYD